MNLLDLLKPNGFLVNFADDTFVSAGFFESA